MTLKTIVLASALTVMSSLALAQTAPIGSSADFGNGAVINRGPVGSFSEDRDFRLNRAASPGWGARHYRTRACAYNDCSSKYRRHHLAEHRR
jgi:hypothetical protein